MVSTDEALAALAPRSDQPPARYALELQPDQDPDLVADTVRARLAAFAPNLRPISPTDDRVLLLDLDTRTLEGTDAAVAFAGGYALAEDFGFRTAEPDLPTPYFPEADPGQPEMFEARAVRLLPGCWVDREDGLPTAWALDRIRAQDAWAFSTSQDRPSRGRGIVVAQPDTGVVRHAELSGVRRQGGFDVLDNDADPTDPLTGLNPGHGTATASVLVSPVTLQISGAAPAAAHMPIRAIRSVIQVTQVSVAAAIEHAVDAGAHVISMSLGGIATTSLQRAVERAVAADVIVLAAAGNCVRSVVWPARYDECIAVAGTNAADQPWRGSCRGPAVDVSAPGQNVFKAESSGPAVVSQGQGTSFAVALTAGVAALWLAHHGRPHLLAAAHARGERLQDMFRRLVRATARRPANWNSFEWGAGIVDANALLRADLTLGVERVTPEVAVRARRSATQRGATVAALVQEVAGTDAAPEEDFDWTRYGPELAHAMLHAQLGSAGADISLEGSGAGGLEHDPQRSPTSGVEQMPVSVSDPLDHSLGNPRLRAYLGLRQDASGQRG